MDSGNMHLAAIAGAPAVSVWGAATKTRRFSTIFSCPRKASKCPGRRARSISRSLPAGAPLSRMSNDSSCMVSLQFLQHPGRYAFGAYGSQAHIVAARARLVAEHAARAARHGQLHHVGLGLPPAGEAAVGMCGSPHAHGGRARPCGPGDPSPARNPPANGG